MSKKEFKRLVQRELRLAVQGMKDGCSDRRCGKPILCPEHLEQAAALILNPRKLIALQTRAVRDT